ncbi:hypothetical protein BDV35DRAFT_370074 [Aspergillus flavus]|uniref:Uncharacterized protein n=1 Tax=Aspergillus flavus TaxID=5059 RepID=A0A5N6GHP6_ASPFL|nr:hypothetical protein BDV35DRAFT_370074 [Aspergillus flavus]
MNLITGLLLSKRGSGALLVVIDKFTNATRLLSDKTIFRGHILSQNSAFNKSGLIGASCRGGMKNQSMDDTGRVIYTWYCGIVAQQGGHSFNIGTETV